MVATTRVEHGRAEAVDVEAGMRDRRVVGRIDANAIEHVEVLRASRNARSIGRHPATEHSHGRAVGGATRIERARAVERLVG